MAIEFRCPECGSRARSAVPGGRASCGECLAIVPVPEVVAEVVDPEPAPEPEPDPVQSPGFGQVLPTRQRHRPAARKVASATRPVSPAVVIGAIIFFGGVCVGLGAWLIPTGEKWHRHESARGGYAIDMPAPLSREIENHLGSLGVPNAQAEGTVHRRGEYLVLWANIQNRLRRADEQIIEDVVRGTGSDRARVTRTQPMTVGGFPAREVVVSGTGDEAGVFRVVVADTRLYVFGVGGPRVDPDGPLARRFLDSFTITDPVLAEGVPYAERVARSRKAAAETAARDEEARQQALEGAFLTGAPASDPSVPDPKVVPGLVAHLSFDEPDPTTDRITGVPGGTLHGGAKVGPGVRGKALYASQPGAGMDLAPLLPKLRFTRKDSFTVAGWYRVNLNRSNFGPPIGVFTCNSPSGVRQLYFQAESLGSNTGPIANVSDLSRSSVESPLQPFRLTTKPKLDDSWHHFALVCERIGGWEVLTLYLDGAWFAPAVRTAATGPVDLSKMASAVLGDAPDWIKSASPTGPGPTFLGAIDEFCVFDRALAGWEVRTLIGKEPVDPDRVRPTSPADVAGVTFHVPFLQRWSGRYLETVSGKDVDHGPNGANLFGEPVPVESPRGAGQQLNTRAVFSSPGYMANLSSAADRFGVAEGKPFTVTAWVRLPDDQKEGCGLVRAAGQNYFAVNVLPGRAEVVLANRAPKVGGVSAPGEPPGAVRLRRSDAPKGWYHLTVTRGEDGEVRLYINGSEGEQPVRARYTGPTNFCFYLGFGYRTEKGDVAIGVDEFATFDRVLTEAEILALAGRKTPPKPLAKNPPKVVPVGPEPLPDGVPGPVASAADIRGLRFYLPCDTIEGTAVKEAVTGKSVGKFPRAELVNGPRGKALRVTAEAGINGGAGLDLADQAVALGVAGGRPFTLAVWVRTDEWHRGWFLRNQSFMISSGGKNSVVLKMLSNGFDRKATPLVVDAAVREGAQWFHLTLTRNERGMVRFGVNGDLKAPNGSFEADLLRQDWKLGFSGEGRWACEFDEFCLFDRVLSDEEIGALAGKGPLPAVTGPKRKEPVTGTVPVPRPPAGGDLGGRTAPRPRLIEQPYTGGAVPAATTIKGLLWYLPCDEFDQGRTTEGVSNKPVGKAAPGAVQLIDGPRGKALRLTVPGVRTGDPPFTALDLSDQVETFRVPAKTPFTFALWVRRVTPVPLEEQVVLAGKPEDSINLNGLDVSLIQQHAVGTIRRRSALPSTSRGGLPESGAWVHLVVQRTQGGRIVVLVNGERQPGKLPPEGASSAEVRCEALKLGVGTGKGWTVDVDEVCLFDRELTDDEIAALAGKKPAPK